MQDQTSIQLTREPLNPAAAIEWVTCPQAGGINLFLGTTRAQAGPAQQSSAGELVALDYHAYEEMAVKEIARIVGLARTRWPMEKVAVWHRLGEVKVTQASVAIAVSSPHRGESFAACQYIIDELKKSVPIWKREIFANVDRWQAAGQDAPVV